MFKNTYASAQLKMPMSAANTNLAAVKSFLPMTDHWKVNFTRAKLILPMLAIAVFAYGVPL